MFKENDEKLFANVFVSKNIRVSHEFLGPERFNKLREAEQKSPSGASKNLRCHELQLNNQKS